MSSLNVLNPKADQISKHHALMVNIGAAKGLQDVVKSNLGPKGTIKMLVGGAGDLKLTKDGCVLLHQMQIQHPTASLIARTATAQDDITGDGTTSIVLFTGELLKQSERYVSDGLHPRVMVEGFEIAREETLKFLEEFRQITRKEGKEEKEEQDSPVDRSLLVEVARTSLRTKLQESMADLMTEIVVDALLCIRRPGRPIDLHMVELMSMEHRSALDTTLVRGLVLDHGARHPNMSRYNENCYILSCNISLEYEKSEVNSSFFYSNAEERERMVKAERKFTDDRVWKIVELKRQVCSGPENENKSFIVINQKGIDPHSLDILQKHGIVGIRRAKKRNMERLALACGGYAVNSVDDLDPACLGYADKVYEHVLGDDKFTFIEGVRNPHSCTILVRGPNKHTIAQIKDAVRDGLRAVLNVMEDQAVVSGAGAFELEAYRHLTQVVKPKVKGRAKLGIQAFADALLIIPKTLASNSGHDTQDTILALLEAAAASTSPVGLDVETGKPMDPKDAGVWDNYRVKRQILHLATVISTKLLLVDEIMRAGRATAKDQAPGQE